MLVHKLNLPLPSVELIAAYRKWEHTAELPASSKHWLDEFHEGKINAAAHCFEIVPELNELLRQQYQQYFTLPISAICGIMQNHGHATTASLPPHSDRARKLAITWYIDLGGDEVDTVFYHEKCQTTDETAFNFQYPHVHELARYRLSNTSWYTYEVDRVHSVEGLQTRRTFLSIAMMDAVSTFDLEKLKSNSSIELLTI
jgi:hypothetical protein